jgi:hypothetical protein
MHAFKKAYAPTKFPTKLVSFKSPENLEQLQKSIVSCLSICYGRKLRSNNPHLLPTDLIIMSGDFPAHWNSEV